MTDEQFYLKYGAGYPFRAVEVAGSLGLAIFGVGQFASVAAGLKAFREQIIQGARGAVDDARKDVARYEARLAELTQE